MKARRSVWKWFECPCGIEYFSPRYQSGPDYEAEGRCWRCHWLVARAWMSLVGTGSAAGVAYRAQAKLRRLACAAVDHAWAPDRLASEAVASVMRCRRCGRFRSVREFAAPIL